MRRYLYIIDSQNAMRAARETILLADRCDGIT